MTREEQLACLIDRPCSACKFHKENGCLKWACVFEQEPDDGPKAKIVVNGNCAVCGKPLTGNNIFICKECQGKENK